MRYYLLLIIATMLMASAFVAGKVLIVAGADPIALVASRFIAAGLIALIWLKVLGKLQMPNSWQGLQGIVIVGSLQSAALFAICFSALDYLSAAVVSLITMTIAIVGRGYWCSVRSKNACARPISWPLFGCPRRSHGCRRRFLFTRS